VKAAYGRQTHRHGHLVQAVHQVGGRAKDAGAEGLLLAARTRYRAHRTAQVI
jgi:hypothetical protein